MSKYQNSFLEYNRLNDRVIEICRLFHRHDPKMFPDIIEDEIMFYLHGEHITALHFQPLDIDFYSIFNIEWLDMDDDDIVKLILERKEGREEYNRKRAELIKEKKNNQ